VPPPQFISRPEPKLSFTPKYQPLNNTTNSSVSNSSNGIGDGKINDMDLKRQAYQAKYYAQKEASPSPKTGSFISKRTTNVYANTLPSNYVKDNNTSYQINTTSYPVNTTNYPINTTSYPINTTSYPINTSSNNLQQNSNYIIAVNNASDVIKNSITPEPIEIPAHLKGRLVSLLLN